MKKLDTTLPHFETDVPLEPSYPDLLSLQSKRRKRLKYLWMTGAALLVLNGIFIVNFLISN